MLENVPTSVSQLTGCNAQQPYNSVMTCSPDSDWQRYYTSYNKLKEFREVARLQHIMGVFRSGPLNSCLKLEQARICTPVLNIDEQDNPKVNDHWHCLQCTCGRYHTHPNEGHCITCQVVSLHCCSPHIKLQIPDRTTANTFLLPFEANGWSPCWLQSVSDAQLLGQQTV